MNREILFKAKRLDNSEWVYGMFFTCFGLTYITVLDEKQALKTKKNELYFTIEVIPETVCQFTGLLDRNNNKIFEEDVLHDPISDLKGTVEFSYEHGGFAFRDSRYQSLDSFINIDVEYFEITSNTHDKGE